jgi:hypothetical protein
MCCVYDGLEPYNHMEVSYSLVTLLSDNGKHGRPFVLLRGRAPTSCRQQNLTITRKNMLDGICKRLILKNI